jgi:CubicO group peptidase (beta-lactamase class C family)/beta-glucosidase-like glycosyl hydrolase
MLKKVFACSFLVILPLVALFAQTDKDRWVDSVFNALDDDEKVGQLFMLSVPADMAGADISRIVEQIKSHNVGGVIFGRQSPHLQANATVRFQEASKVPLFVGQDAEWGLGQMVDSTMSFPRPLVLGALSNDSLLVAMGRETAAQMKMLGLNLMFGPVADINNDPQDPMMSYRSYGASADRVAKKASAFSKGLYEGGVVSCVKHFTIQGLTILDINDDLPYLQASIDTVKAYPYQKLFELGVAGVMPAATTFPLFYEDIKMVKKNAFDAETLSLLFTGKWLKEQMNFKGLSFVDLQQLQDATDKYRSGDVEFLAFQAGNDVLIGSEDVAPAVRKIRKFIRSDQRLEDQLNETVKRILAAKYDAGAYRELTLNLDNLGDRLNNPAAKLLSQKLYEQAVTIVRNSSNTLPVVTLENRNFAYITSEASAVNEPFYNYLNRYVNAGYFTVNEQTDLVELANALDNQDVIIVGVFPQTQPGIVQRLDRVLDQLKSSRQIIYCDFGNETFLKSAAQRETVVTAYTNTDETLRAVPQVIFGALPASGVLPFSAANQLPEGTGIRTSALDRLSFSQPEDARMSGKALERIVAIAEEAIRIGATPGCQVLVARHGKIVYDKIFGSLTYGNTSPVTTETIYDLASVTKVSATLQAVMFMYDKGLIDINKKVSYYLPELKKTNKRDITILEMLTHQAGLAPFIPMWTETVRDTTYLPAYYSRQRNVRYPLQVSPNLFGSPQLRDSVWMWIGKSKLLEKPVRTPFSYRYSDLGFMILQRLAERVLNQPLDEFVAQNLYEPLGAYSTGFTPLDRFPASIIAPTENDKIYRKVTVVGTVHDERAAMMGGVSGHAGLFSNANDLAKLGQMLLQEGEYGGTRYYKPETVRTFSNKQFDSSRRGLGWDKPVQSDWNGPTSIKASPLTFGHTGFTGTCIWIDPAFDLVYIFLSNRVYPDRNSKLISANIRSRIQDVVYESIFEYCEQEASASEEPVRTVLSSKR